jgi:hypothetical protein
MDTLDDQNEKLTKEDCFRILELYRNWNTGQKSSTLVMTGGRTEEDDILDARRRLLKRVQTRLEELT